MRRLNPRTFAGPALNFVRLLQMDWRLELPPNYEIIAYSEEVIDKDLKFDLWEQLVVRFK